MLSGDIDLTENLDFRKTVKREIPKFPTSWNGESSERKTTIDITRTNNNITLSSSSYITNNTNNNIINYDIDGYDLIISQNNTINNANSYVIYPESNIWFDGNTIKYITSTKPTKNVFGEIVNEIQDEYIPKIPWKVNNDKYKLSYNKKRIPWKTESEYTYRNRYFDDRIPWDCEEDDWYDVKPNLSTRNERARILICWLNYKSISFIRKYLDRKEDESDLKYLTNMNWIGVKDAIID